MSYYQMKMKMKMKGNYKCNEEEKCGMSNERK
jgi:hypothetical protein